MKAIFDFRAWRNTMAPLLPASSAERITLPPSHATFARAASPPATSLCSGSTVAVPPLMVSRASRLQITEHDPVMGAETDDLTRIDRRALSR